MLITCNMEDIWLHINYYISLVHDVCSCLIFIQVIHALARMSIIILMYLHVRNLSWYNFALRFLSQMQERQWISGIMIERKFWNGKKRGKHKLLGNSLYTHYLGVHGGSLLFPKQPMPRKAILNELLLIPQYRYLFSYQLAVTPGYISSAILLLCMFLMSHWYMQTCL